MAEDASPNVPGAEPEGAADDPTAAIDAILQAVIDSALQGAAEEAAAAAEPAPEEPVAETGAP
eukprot:4830226-Alexandrium_andersonii.AAC.1